MKSSIISNKIVESAIGNPNACFDNDEENNVEEE